MNFSQTPQNTILMQQLHQNLQALDHDDEVKREMMGMKEQKL